LSESPTDARKADVPRALARIGFEVVREREHISLRRANDDGSRSIMTLPNARRIKGSTLQSACHQAGVERDEFLRALRR
jgi:hypothetical protein